ncbi:MAG: hypothetical protein HYS04_14825 [Acidobacteria bacterium]|nr:hypothetical protein [Acidobacteriota bacterium]
MENSTLQYLEKIYRIWSAGARQEISIRIQYRLEKRNACRIYTLASREVWS